MTIDNHCPPSFFKCLMVCSEFLDFERLLDGFTFFVKMCPKIATLEYQATYLSTLSHRLYSV